MTVMCMIVCSYRMTCIKWLFENHQSNNNSEACFKLDIRKSDSCFFKYALLFTCRVECQCCDVLCLHMSML